ncbi:MAG: hypothetical protein MUF38_00490 [Anaerolineae bacterium]|nr:hypothetical protein [Anaerolineae bacterium]
MGGWGLSLRNGAIVGVVLCSAAAIYLAVTGGLTWLSGAVVVGLGVVCVGLGVLGTRVAALSELIEESQQTDAELQRKLNDLMAQGADRFDLSALAERLGVSPERTAEVFEGLVELGIWAGAVTWDSTVIYPRRAGYTSSLAGCLHCGEPLAARSAGQPMVCGVCRTRHIDPA